MKDAADFLADAICDDRLIVVTGAGLSKGLLNTAGQPLPDWIGALSTLSPSASAGVQRNVRRLTRKNATGSELAFAASLLERDLGRSFTESLKQMFTLDPSTGIRARRDAYDAVHALKPRGIVTFNVDGGHRRWIRDNKQAKQWSVLDPTLADGEDKFRDLVRTRMSEPFILEAHGSVSTEPVFTAEGYRTLFGRSPAYRAFLQHILSSQRLLFVGFSLADHDFNRVLDDLANAYGGPVNDHVWMSPREPRLTQEYLRLKEMYGITHYPLTGWSQLAPALNRAAHEMSPRLRKIIEDSLSNEIDCRRAAHRQASALPLVAKKIMLNALAERLKVAPIADRRKRMVADTSELLYLCRRIGSIDATADRQLATAILTILETADHSEILAHGALALEPFATKSHLPRLKKLWIKWSNNKPYTDTHYRDPDDRVGVYFRKLVLEIEASGK